MTYEEHIDRWVSGESVHNKEKDMCCPDFSCCIDGINTPVEIKERFAEAYKSNNDIVLLELLDDFLSGALKTIGIEIHIPKEH